MVCASKVGHRGDTMVDLFSSGILGKGNMAATAATRGTSSKKVKQ